MTDKTSKTEPAARYCPEYDDEATPSIELSGETMDLLDADLFDMLLPGKQHGTPLSLEAYMEKMVALGQCNGNTAWAVGWCNAAAWIALKCFPDAIGSKIPGEDRYAVVSMALYPETAQAIQHTGGVVIEEGVWKPVVWNWRAQLSILFLPRVRDAKGKEKSLVALIPISDLMLVSGQDTFGFEKFPDPKIALRNVYVPKNRVVSIEALMQDATKMGKCATHWRYRMSASALLTLHAVFPLHGMAAAARAFIQDQKTVLHGSDAILKGTSDQIDMAVAILSRSIQKIELHAICNVPLTTEECSGIRRSAALANQLFLTAIESLTGICNGMSQACCIAMQRKWRVARTLGLRAAIAIRESAALFKIP